MASASFRVLTRAASISRMPFRYPAYLASVSTYRASKLAYSLGFNWLVRRGDIDADQTLKRRAQLVVERERHHCLPAPNVSSPPTPLATPPRRQRSHAMSQQMHALKPMFLHECRNVDRHGGVRVRFGVWRAPVVAHVECVHGHPELAGEAARQAAPVGF